MGCPRSGTTLLQSYLAAHPDIVSFPESHFFARLAPYERWRRVIGLASPGSVHRFRQVLHRIGETDADVRVPHRAFLLGQYVRAFVRVLDASARTRGASHWLEKTPRHLHSLDLIRRYVRRAAVIHIVRGGRDVVASLYDVTHRYPEVWSGARSIDQCVDRWNEDMTITRRYVERPGHFLVRYEELVRDPEAVLRAACTFVRVPFRPEMLEHQQRAAAAIIRDHEPWKDQVAGGLTRTPSAKFDTIFDKAQQAYVIGRLDEHEFVHARPLRESD